MSSRHDNPAGRGDEHGTIPRPLEDRRPSRRRYIAVALLSLALVALVASTSLVAYLAEANPEMALRLRPNDSVALLNLADRKLVALVAAKQTPSASTAAGRQGGPQLKSFANPALNRILPHRIEQMAESAETAEPAAPAQSAPSLDTAAELADIRSLAERALASDPLSARALRILGQVAEEAGEQAKAVELMRRAVRLSMQETSAVYFMMVNSFSQKSYEEALYYADILLRTRPGLRLYATPLLAQMAENPAASDALLRLLATRPPWRSSTLVNMLYSMTDARTPLSLLLALKDTAGPPDEEELGSYLRFLIQKNFYELAYYTWLQFLPPEQLGSARLVFNGGFEKQPAGQPFDWTIRQGTSVTVEIAPAPESGDNRALRVSFGSGRVNMVPMTQRLMLAPGTYTLSYRLRGDLTGRRGLKWIVACATQTVSQLGESAMFIGQQRGWRQHETEFTVSEQGCHSQELRLVHDSRSASEEFASGTVWYDDVEITRAREKPTAEAR